MSRKDYVLIAQVINNAKGYLTTDQVEDLTYEFCSALKHDNPNFNRDMFTKAVGVIE